MKSKVFCLMLMCLPLLLQGCVSLNIGGLGNNRGMLKLEEIEPAESLWTSSQVLMIPLTGMVDEGGMRAPGGEPGMLVGLKDRLLAAQDNPLIKAIVIKIDSPGGTVTASDLILHELKMFKAENPNIPLVVMMGDTAASGGVYVAMGGDEIYALPTTITGSIGVISIYPQIVELSRKIGLSVKIIASGKNKASGLFVEMTPEQEQIFQDMIQQEYQRFIDIIVESRASKGLTRSKLLEVADGRILTPQQALEIKLIDGIKYPEEVFTRARELANLTDARVVSYEYPANYRGHVYAQAQAQSSSVKQDLLAPLGLDTAKVAQYLASGPMMYLWMP